MLFRLCLLTLIVFVGGTAALRCYLCNSISEPGCLRNPPESLAANCTEGRQVGAGMRHGVSKPLVCWTQYQDVKGTKVVVRHCGGPESTANGTNQSPESYDRVGSKGIRVSYHKCTGDLCNSAAVSSYSGAVLGLCALLVSAVRRFD